EEPLARRLAPRVLHLAEARARRQGAGARAGEVERPVVGVTQRDVALRDPQPVSDPVELRAGLREEASAALEAPDGLFDEREQDEALRPPEDVAHLRAALHRFEERRPRAGVVAEQVVDLAEDDLGVRPAGGVADAHVALERLNDHRATPRGLPQIAGDVAEQPERRPLVPDAPRLPERPPGRLRLGARLV